MQCSAEVGVSVVLQGEGFFYIFQSFCNLSHQITDLDFLATTMVLDGILGMGYTPDWR